MRRRWSGWSVLLQFNGFAILAGIASLVIVAIYPFMKRITWWPQIVLGLAFSWGALMGLAALLGRVDAPALLLYAGSIAWVIGYDTIYAHQDREDDALIGIKSTARLFGARTRPVLVLFYALAVVLIGAALARRRRVAGVDRAGRVRGASGWRSRGSTSAIRRYAWAVQVEPRRRADPVRGLAGRCGCCGLDPCALMISSVAMMCSPVMHILDFKSRSPLAGGPGVRAARRGAERGGGGAATVSQRFVFRHYRRSASPRSISSRRRRSRRDRNYAKRNAQRWGRDGEHQHLSVARTGQAT